MSKLIGNFLSSIIPKKHLWKIKLFGHWDKIIGNLKGKVRIEKITDKSITLGVSHSTWAQELYILSPVLKKKINNILEENRIEKIQFKTVSFKSKPKVTKTIKIKEKPSPKDYSLTIIEHDKLSAIENNELTGALAKFYIRCKKTTCSAILLFLTFIGSAHGAGVPESSISLINTTTENKIRHSTIYLKANFFHKSGQYQQAFKAYDYLISHDASPYIYDGYLRLLSDTNQFLAIACLIDKTKTLFNEDLDIQLIYAQSLLNTNRHQQAEELLEKLKDKNPDNGQISYYLASHHARSNKLKKALETIETFIEKAQRKNKLFLFYFLKSKILLKMGQKHLSLKAVNHCLSLASNFVQAILFKALLMEQLQNLGLAIECYRKYLSIVGDAPAISKQVIHLLFKLNKFSEAAEELSKFQIKTAEQLYDLALLEWKAKSFSSALSHVNMAISKIARSQSGLLTRVRLLKIEILHSHPKEKISTVQNLVIKWLIENPENKAFVYLLFSLCKRGLPVTKAIYVLEKVLEAKKSYGIALALADLHLLNNKKSLAISQYEKILSQTKNETFKTELSKKIQGLRHSLPRRHNLPRRQDVR